MFLQNPFEFAKIKIFRKSVTVQKLAKYPTPKIPKRLPAWVSTSDSKNNQRLDSSWILEPVARITCFCNLSNLHNSKIVANLILMWIKSSLGGHFCFTFLETPWRPSPPWCKVSLVSRTVRWGGTRTPPPLKQPVETNQILIDLEDD